MLDRRLAPPRSIGILDNSILENIQELLPNQDTGADWYKSGKPSDRPDLLEALEPVTELLLEEEALVLGSKPDAIAYTVDTRPAPPRRSQRLTTFWHVDGGGCKTVVVASALPTEFLAKDSGASRSARKLRKEYLSEKRGFARRRSLYLAPDPPDELLQQAGLTIFRPEPYEMVVMRNNMHRSPRNFTEETVVRTWLRAAIIRQQPPRKNHR